MRCVPCILLVTYYLFKDKARRPKVSAELPAFHGCVPFYFSLSITNQLSSHKFDVTFLNALKPSFGFGSFS
ncbi:hypothetical protein ES703_60405 [subsurface metagenome]